MLEFSEDALKLLFVDDDQSLHQYLTRKLGSLGYDVRTACHWDEAKEVLSSEGFVPDLVLIDPLFKNGTPPARLQAICEEVGPVPVVVVSSLREPGAVADAIRGGVREYVSKPFEVASLDDLLRRVLEASQEVPDETPAKTTTKELELDFIFSSGPMQQVYDVATQVADKSVPVLLLGESGVGKDVVGRLVHEHSLLKDKPFVKVNCAAMPAELVESELFGYVKGAFTGAYIDRPGKFEFANGGTIFLDEIGEFPPSVQAKLLQVLQDGRFTRLGSNQEIQVDVRVIAATNRKLEEAIEKGEFREDLYYRLNVVNIEIPPLRRRKEEIALFCEHFVKRFSEEYGSTVTEIPKSLLKVFEDYSWPGNVRQLENIVKRYIVLQDADSIRNELQSKMTKDSFDELDEMAESYLRDNPDEVDLKEVSKRASLMVEKNMIERTLQKTNWNKWKAAKELKVSYKTLLTKIELYEIHPKYDS